MKRSVPVESASAFIDEKIKQLGDWRGLSDDVRYFRNEIHDESSIRSQRFPKSVAPGRKLRLAFAKQRP